MTADGVELFTTSVRSEAKKAIDTLVVPGGFLVDDVTRDRALVQWIAKMAPGRRRICSVCVGSFLLAEAGILDDAAPPPTGCMPRCWPAAIRRWP
jgi:transcriptional regulator GlxA family with amidase domain